MAAVLGFVLISVVIFLALGNPVQVTNTTTTTAVSSKTTTTTTTITTSTTTATTGTTLASGRDYTCLCDTDECYRLRTDQCTTKGRCFVHVGDDGRKRHGCSYTFESGELMCHSNAKPGQFACCLGDLCNKGLMPSTPRPPALVAEKETSSLSFILIVAVSVVVSVLLLLAIALFFIRRHIYKRREDSLLTPQDARLLEEDIFGGLRQEQSSTGSGSGMPNLVPRTVGKQVTLIEKIGKGRFGEVWRGKWQDEDVAVKIFTSLEETSWKQEMGIYNTGMLRHENILGFYASDTIGIFSCTKNLLIVHYHPYGSLYDYLQMSDIDMEDMLNLSHSAAAGLNHLHYEIKQGTGMHEKPSIAHRDIKSKNILVKANGECCIGDLGHAVKNTASWDPGRDKLLVGTKRYMAPEVLTKTMNPHYFESFKRVDIYAFGLVMWEIARRARPFTEQYNVPFYNMVQADPSIEEMKKVVVNEQQRPPIPNKWAKDPLMCEMEKLIQGCWTQIPSNRLTVLRVKKNLHRLLKAQSRDSIEKKEKLSPKFIDGSITANTSVTTTTGS